MVYLEINSFKKDFFFSSFYMKYKVQSKIVFKGSEALLLSFLYTWKKKFSIHYMYFCSHEPWPRFYFPILLLIFSEKSHWIFKDLSTLETDDLAKVTLPGTTWGLWAPLVASPLAFWPHARLKAVQKGPGGKGSP